MAARIDTALVIEARRLLQAAIRRLSHLEHPSGYLATHNGQDLLRESLKIVREAKTKLESM